MGLRPWPSRTLAGSCADDCASAAPTIAITAARRRVLGKRSPLDFKKRVDLVVIPSKRSLRSVESGRTAQCVASSQHINRVVGSLPLGLQQLPFRAPVPNHCKFSLLYSVCRFASAGDQMTLSQVVLRCSVGVSIFLSIVS